MDEKIEKIVYLIKTSDLDETIKDILVRDLLTEGLTDFLREQIKAYCLEAAKKNDPQVAEATEALQESNQNPAE